MVKLIVILLAVILLALPQPALADGPPDSGRSLAWPGPFKNPESEYYRGIYDACIFAAAYARLGRAEAVGACRQAVDQARTAGWYEQPSLGWDDMQRVPAGWGRET